MRRKLFNFAADVSLGLWIGWFILIFNVVHMSRGYYCWGILVPPQFLWLLRYSLLIWCVLFVLPACRLVLAAHRRWMTLGRSLDGYCCRCGYDLTGNVSGTCPECVTPVAGNVGAKA
ncbi:MAG TPA: hypothetical protein VK797_09040 [Tepidisphaeraceae bacterium]|nr:hypothetical protein [Tepidisphaeraceae bacterium]